MKIFVDTNVFLRFYLEEKGDQFERSKKLLSDIEDGLYQAYTSDIVFLEISFVLKSVYNLPLPEVRDILKSLQNLKGLKLIEKTNLRSALAIFNAYNIKFSDCLIVSQIPTDTTLVTFDKEFDRLSSSTNKIPGIKIMHP